MSVEVPYNHCHILYHHHRHGYELNISHQYPNYRENPNTCNLYGTTPLHVICLSSYGIKVAEGLIKSGAQVNATNHFGSTPLHFAVIHRNEWMVEILIEHGADVNFQDMDGNTALHFATRNSRTLLYDPEDETSDLWIIQKLINNGANIDLHNNDLETPLMWAVKEGDLDIVKELLGFGAKVNTRNIELETCLHVASKCTKPNSEILIELVKYGACVNCHDQDGKTALDALLLSRNRDEGIENAKALIKTATLVNTHGKAFVLEKELNVLTKFIRHCSEEVIRMKSVVYFDKFSLYNFALVGHAANPRYSSEESIFDKILMSLSKGSFPIYHDVIEAHFKRSYLCEKLTKIRIYAKNERGDTRIYLNCDVILEILYFLPDKDLFSLVKAYLYYAFQ